MKSGAISLGSCLNNSNHLESLQLNLKGLMQGQDEAGVEPLGIRSDEANQKLEAESYYYLSPKWRNKRGWYFLSPGPGVAPRRGCLAGLPSGATTREATGDRKKGEKYPGSSGFLGFLLAEYQQNPAAKESGKLTLQREAALPGDAEPRGKGKGRQRRAREPRAGAGILFTCVYPEFQRLRLAHSEAPIVKMCLVPERGPRGQAHKGGTC